MPTTHTILCECKTTLSARTTCALSLNWCAMLVDSLLTWLASLLLLYCFFSSRASIAFTKFRAAFFHYCRPTAAQR